MVNRLVLSFYVQRFISDPPPVLRNFDLDSGTGSVCSDFIEDVEVEKVVAKKIINPDILIMSKLLNFEEVIKLILI